MAGPPLARLRVEMTADSASLEKGLKDAATAMQRAATVAVAVGQTIATVGLEIANRFMAAVGNVVGGIQQVAQAAKQLGVGVEELSRLRFAADSVGVSFEELSGGLQKLGDKIEEAASKSGSEAARAFAAIGIAVRDSDGEVRGATDVFREIAERFLTYADNADRAKLATALFGDKADAMAKVAALGTSELDRLADASDRIGTTAGRQAAEALEAISQFGRDAANSLAGLATMLINHVAPTILTTVDYFRQSTTSAYLLQVAVDVVAGAFKALAEILISANAGLEIIGASLSGVWQAIKALGSGDLDGIKAALSGIGTETAAAWERASQAMRNLNSNIASTWETTTQFADGTRSIVPTFQSASEATKAHADEMRRLRDEMQLIVSDPMTTYQEKLAAIAVAEASTAISTEKAQMQRRRAYEMTARIAETSFQSVGRALSALFPKSKAAAISEALINTYVGITQALRAGPPPWNFIQAAAVGAMGFAQVRSITSTSENGGGAAASSAAPASDAAAVAPSQMLSVQGLSGDGLMSMLSVRALAERLVQFQADGGQVVIA